MTSKKGVTVIGHDSENRIYLKGRESPGFYIRNANYDISIEDIVAIMKHSQNCEQFISYQCYASLLLDKGYGWWVSR